MMENEVNKKGTWHPAWTVVVIGWMKRLNKLMQVISEWTVSIELMKGIMKFITVYDT